MKKIGIFYAAKADKTSWVAEKIQKEFGTSAESVAIENAWQNDFEAYDNFIVGASTWFDGELPTYWDELLPELRTLQLKGKKVAIFGLGDQVKYPENFADGVGLLAEVFENDGATLVGFTSIDGYSFERSRALKGDKWCGLVIDIENQSEMTDKRINLKFDPVIPQSSTGLTVMSFVCYSMAGLCVLKYELYCCPSVFLLMVYEGESVLFCFPADSRNIIDIESAHK